MVVCLLVVYWTCLGMFGKLCFVIVIQIFIKFYKMVEFDKV